jgi:phosphoribosylformylglycinamidine synthase subunit PurS
MIFLPPAPRRFGALAAAVSAFAFRGGSAIVAAHCWKPTAESEEPMLAKVYVTLKDGVLDPQGKAIHHAATTIGYRSIADIRQGKYFEITLDPSIDGGQAHAEVEKLAHEVLSNPVIEDYEIDLVSD